METRDETYERVMAYLLSRATYERGRFLAGAIAALSPTERGIVEGRMVADNHPLSWVAGTCEYRITAYVRGLAEATTP